MHNLNKVLVIFTWFVCFFISTGVSADSVLIDFKSTSSGFGRLFKIVKIMPDETSIPCYANTVQIGLQGKNSQSSTLISNKEEVTCDNKDFLSVNEAVNKYADIIGRDVWITVESSAALQWRGVCLVYISNGSITQPLTCADQAHSNISCSIVNGDITLNHGTVQNKNVNGNSVSKNIQLDCTGDTDVTITAGPSFNVYDGTIPLNGDNSLRAVISINGVQNSTGKTFELKNGQNTISLGSTLRTSKTDLAGGTYSGTGVLVVSPQ